VSNVAGIAGQEVTLEFTREPQDVVAVRSKPVVLQCAVSSSAPGPVNISWTHDDRILPLVNDTRRYLLANGSLYIKKVRKCACACVSIGRVFSVIQSF
jgi:hypothetical protein